MANKDSSGSVGFDDGRSRGDVSHGPPANASHGPGDDGSRGSGGDGNHGSGDDGGRGSGGDGSHGSGGDQHHGGDDHDHHGAICFVAGIRIMTPAGEVAVEDLAIGDVVTAIEGGVVTEKPVRWIGRQTVSTRFADPMRLNPVRIKAGALGEALPVRDLLVSPAHALLVDGVLVQAGALVNGSSISREGGMPEVFVYYHVELDDHALVLAEGVAAESFIDNVERMAFDNWEEHVALYPDGHEISEMSLPRATSARQVPGATKRRLSARAAEMQGNLVQAA